MGNINMNNDQRWVLTHFLKSLLDIKLSEPELPSKPLAEMGTLTVD
jgi:hypothetical protein